MMEQSFFIVFLPHYKEEVPDHKVFYSKQSLVFPKAENRKWTVISTMAAQMEKLEYN
jgi:ornithine carbamoyltransferase